MKILVTGTSGFIGQHFVQRTQNDYDIISFESDLTDFNKARQEVLDHNPDQIVHLAARTEVEKSFYEPMVFSHINYLGTENLVNAACELSQLKNFIFSSTMEVYGWQPVSDEIKNGNVPDILPVFDENTVPHPNAPYAVAKLACEKYLEYAHRCKNLPFTALRQTNTYGRKDNNFFVVEQIITQMLNNPSEINIGYREPYRNFLYIDDLIDLWVEIVKRPELVNQGEIFTIGPANAVSIESLADMIAKKLNWNGKINWNEKPERPGEIYLLNSSCKKINSFIGWEPKVELNDGLDYTINAWKEKEITKC